MKPFPSLEIVPPLKGITKTELLVSAETMIKNEYGKYLYDLATQTPQKLPN